MGACLIQNDRIVAYISRRFKEDQIRLSVTRKEAYGLTQAAWMWRNLQSPDTEVWTDHRALEG